MNSKHWLALALMAWVPVLFAVDQPSAKEVNKVLEYYDNGYKMGPMVVDMKLCKEVSRKGDNKNDCGDVYKGNNITAGQEAYVWMKLIVPKGVDAEKLLLQFNHQDVTRMVRHLTVRSGIRYRTWTKVALGKEGSWSVKVMHDNGSKVKKLAELPVNITSNQSASNR